MNYRNGMKRGTHMNFPSNDTAIPDGYARFPSEIGFKIWPLGLLLIVNKLPVAE